MELNFPALMTTQTDLFFNHSSLWQILVYIKGGNHRQLWWYFWHLNLSYSFFGPMDRSDGMDSHDKKVSQSSPEVKITRLE